MLRKFSRTNFYFAVVTAILFGYFSYLLGNRISDGIFDFDAIDSWFESDIPRVVSNMSFRMGGHPFGNHYRTNVHPLFSIFSFPPSRIIAALLGVSLYESARILTALIAGLWGALLFLIFRGMGCRFLDSFLFTLLSGVSAASIFWLSVPETYAWGSVTILVALGFALLVQTQQFAWHWYAVVSALTYSMTITNWMAGILVCFTKYPGLTKFKKGVQEFTQQPKLRLSIPNAWSTWRNFLLVQIAALTLVFGLALIQRRFFPTAALSFLDGGSKERYYINMPESGGPLRAFVSMVLHTVVMPAIQIRPKEGDLYNWPFMLTQMSNPGSGSVWGALAVGLWLGLLGLGIWSFFKVKNYSKFRFVLGLTLLGQIGLHLVYGGETFLYSLHILPLLILVAAFSSLTSLRPFGLVLAGTLIVLVGLNNFQQFHLATDYVHQFGYARQAVKAEIKRRPNDPWPRGVGHILLGFPGSYEEEKAYHEPGGSFSPVANSLGISFWVTDASGNPSTTSDDIPLHDLKQELVYTDNSDIPGVLTKTEFYKSLWQVEDQNRWRLRLNPIIGTNQSISILIRSVGPAGGPIDSINWDGQKLSIQQSRQELCAIAEAQREQDQQYPLLAKISNYTVADRCQSLNADKLQWALKIEPQPKLVVVGHEGDKDWKTSIVESNHWEGEDGWGFARLEFNQMAEVKLSIERLNSISTPLLKKTADPFSLDLPDQQFVDSLKAQVAHLSMSLVEHQPRPGEPINYPLPWQRDGAYTVVALARIGQVDIAKQLALYFAEHDFFGGFGPEADAPGLSLWAIEQVATQARDPGFDQQVWPHVKRKVEWIERMLTTTETLYGPVSSPVIPSSRSDPELNLVADAAEEGLIVGRMDHHRPVLFVNAVSYGGLLAASELAGRLGFADEQTHWQNQAEQLQQAWSKKFRNDQDGNDRTYIAGLWPTWIASNVLGPYQEQLTLRLNNLESSKENGTYAPSYTYFDVAEAHQWLYLGDLRPVWDTLEWFWQHQASPGLFTWWEGSGEENTSEYWKFIRGWLNPPHVTPHYWTASEMLLLQLDTLAYIDKSTSIPELVVAGGIPKAWFEKPMAVENLPLAGRSVSWSWNGTIFKVHVDGEPIQVRLGQNVPRTRL